MADGKAIELELTVAIKQLLFLFHDLLFEYLGFLGSVGGLESLGYTLCLLVCTRPKQLPYSDTSLSFQVVRNPETTSFPVIQLEICLRVDPAGL